MEDVKDRRDVAMETEPSEAFKRMDELMITRAEGYSDCLRANAEAIMR